MLYMQLVIDKYGSVIKRKENVFQIVNKDEKKMSFQRISRVRL